MKTPAIIARLVLFTAIASLGIAYHRTSHASALPACDGQAIAKAGRGYVCTVKTKGGPVSWRVEAVVVSGSRTFRVFQDQKSGLYVSDDLGRHSHDSVMKESLCASDGEFGAVNAGCNGNGNISLRCVGQVAQ